MLNNEQIPNITLHQNDIHLWLSFPNDILEKSLLSVYWDILSKEEQEKQKKFYFNKDRHLYLVSHALVRTTLSCYTGIDPRKLEFMQNSYGRPEISARGKIIPLKFNLSHTDGLVACAVVLKEEIGVDVETINRSENIMKIADRFFAVQEKNDLNMINSNDKKKRFIDYWTLKESYAKAKGMGLYMPFEKFNFHISDSDPITVSFDPELDDNPEQWQFILLEPVSDYRVALSVSKSMKPNMRVKTKKVVPLEKVETLDCEIISKSN